MCKEVVKVTVEEQKVVSSSQNSGLSQASTGATGTDSRHDFQRKIVAELRSSLENAPKGSLNELVGQAISFLESKIEKGLRLTALESNSEDVSRLSVEVSEPTVSWVEGASQYQWINIRLISPSSTEETPPPLVTISLSRLWGTWRVDGILGQFTPEGKDMAQSTDQAATRHKLAWDVNPDNRRVILVFGREEVTNLAGTYAPAYVK